MSEFCASQLVVNRDSNHSVGSEFSASQLVAKRDSDHSDIFVGILFLFISKVCGFFNFWIGPYFDIIFFLFSSPVS